MVEPVILTVAAGSVTFALKAKRVIKSNSPDARLNKMTDAMDDARRKLIASAKYIENGELTAAKVQLERISEEVDCLRDERSNKTISWWNALFETRSLAYKSQKAVKKANRLSSNALQRELAIVAAEEKKKAGSPKDDTSGRRPSDEVRKPAKTSGDGAKKQAASSSELSNASTSDPLSCQCYHPQKDFITQPLTAHVTVIISTATALLCPVHNPFTAGTGRALTPRDQSRLLGMSKNLALNAAILESLCQEASTPVDDPANESDDFDLPTPSDLSAGSASGDEDESESSDDTD